MIIENIKNILNYNYDIIVIGSGPAGISICLSLANTNFKILVIEAGNLEPFQETNKYLSGTIVNKNYANIEYTRLRQFGGTSSIWGGNCNLMENTDFYGWPIKKEELDNFINPAKKILNIKNNFYVKNINKNIDLVNLQWSDINFGKKYFSFFKNSKNIDLLLNTSFINFEGKDKKIINANVLNKKKYKLKGKFYVLACGGLENSRLLEWTRVKNNNLIQQKLPIGNYFMDHPYYNVGSGLINVNRLKSFLKNKVPELNLILECERSLHISPSKNFLINKKTSDLKIQIKFKKLSNNFKRQLVCAAPKYFQKLILSNELSNMSEVALFVIHEQKPKFHNRVTLDDNKDPNDIPKIKLFWDMSNDIELFLSKFLFEFSKLMIENEIGRLAINNSFQEKNIIVGNHQLGGTRMGFDNSDSVVDKNLKVHGVKNLFVSGSSVFRSGGHAHPTFTIVQLSVKLAEFLKSNLKSL